MKCGECPNREAFDSRRSILAHLVQCRAAPASQAGRIRKPEADAAGPCAQDLFLQMCQASEHDTPLLRLLRLQQAAAPAAGGAAVRPAPPRGAPERQPCAGQ